MKRGDTKAISPVIATVLLIAIVLVIALIIFLWFRGLTEEAVVKFGKNIELVCDEVSFDASYSNSVVSISNTGNAPIQQMKIKVIEDGSHSTEDLGFVTPLLSGRAKEYDVSDLITLDTTEIVLIPVLRGVSDEGEQNYICNERYGYNILIV